MASRWLLLLSLAFVLNSAVPQAAECVYGDTVRCVTMTTMHECGCRGASTIERLRLLVSYMPLAGTARASRLRSARHETSRSLAHKWCFAANATRYCAVRSRLYGSSSRTAQQPLAAVAARRRKQINHGRRQKKARQPQPQPRPATKGPLAESRKTAKTRRRHARRAARGETEEDGGATRATTKISSACRKVSR